MIGKILKDLQGRPCSCPVGKQCSKCQTKTAERVKPRILIESSKPLPVPVKVTTYKEKPAKSFHLPYQIYHPYKEPPLPIRSHQKNKSWNKFRKPSLTKSANRQSSISQWYKKRKAESDLKKFTKLEQRESARIEKAQRRREEEFIKQLNARQRKQDKESKTLLYDQRRREAEFIKHLNAKKRKEEKEFPVEECPLYPGGDPYIYKPPKVKKAKKVKATEAKLCCRSEVVCSHAKKFRRSRSIGDKLTICCWRLCCQFYCCITFVLLVGLVVVFFS